MNRKKPTYTSRVTRPQRGQDTEKENVNNEIRYSRKKKLTKIDAISLFGSLMVWSDVDYIVHVWLSFMFNKYEIIFSMCSN